MSQTVLVKINTSSLVIFTIISGKKKLKNDVILFTFKYLNEQKNNLTLSKFGLQCFEATIKDVFQLQRVKFQTEKT